MISLPILSMVCCIAYVVFIIFKYGVPVSISETYYILPNKWDWMFSGWCVLTAVPIGVYWFIDAPDALKWIPMVCVIAMLFIGVSCRYKSGPKFDDDVVSGNTSESMTVKTSGSVKDFLKGLAAKFAPKEFLKYGWARAIHYFNSILLIVLSTVYLCMMGGQSIASTILLYPMFIIVGLKVDGVYNKAYSADVDNKAWIFFMEVICFMNLFLYFLGNVL